ncbi:MAG: acetyltransferase [Myxococcota bacterium]
MNTTLNPPPLVILGASGHAHVVCDIALLLGLEVEAFAETTPRQRHFLGRPILTEADVLQRPPGSPVFVGIGNPRVRRALTGRCLDAGLSLATLIHPTAVVAHDVVIGSGSVVMARAVINPGTQIGSNVIINTGAVVDHDCVLGDLVHICPGSTLAGTVSVGEGTWIGAGATASNNVHIGRWTMVGAGGVVVHDLPDDVIAYGVPAAIKRHGRYFSP